jgi:hypothetical protein
MSHIDIASLKGRAMNASSQTAQSSTSLRAPEAAGDVFARASEDDFAIGCECANPALQIEAWCPEAAAQPLQRLA